jgi:hypothetical protein
MWKNVVAPGSPQTTIQYGTCVLLAGYLRLQTHNQNRRYLLLFHCNNGCTNEPQMVRYTYIVCVAIQTTAGSLLPFARWNPWMMDQNLDVIGSLVWCAVPGVWCAVPGVLITTGNICNRQYRDSRVTELMDGTAFYCLDYPSKV